MNKWDVVNNLKIRKKHLKKLKKDDKNCYLYS